MVPFHDIDDADNTDAADTADDVVQRLLNDAKRAELEERYGARFFRRAGADIPPEVEGLWLDHIEEFERQSETADVIPLRRYVGIGTLRAPADIPAAAMEDELEALLGKLAAHEVFVDFPDHIDAAEAYRFIATELLDEELPEIRIPGMRTHFVYEEFRT